MFIYSFVCFQKIKKPSKYIKKRTSRSKSVPIYSSSKQVMMETSFPPPPIPYLQRTISQESVRSVRNQDIFDKRATRKLSLLSLPTNLNYLEELEKSCHDMNANRKGSCRSISIHRSWLQGIIIYIIRSINRLSPFKYGRERGGNKQISCCPYLWKTTYLVIQSNICNRYVRFRSLYIGIGGFSVCIYETY